MDPRTTNFSALRQVFRAEPVECLSAEAGLLPLGRDRKIDENFKASGKFPNSGIGSINVNLSRTTYFGVRWIVFPSVVVAHREVPVSEGQSV